MRSIIVVLFLCIAANAFAAADRVIEAKYITNGAATLTIPTTTSGLVPDTRTVNGHALTGNVTVSKSDLSLDNVTNDAQVKKSEYTTKSGVLIATGAGTYSELASAGAGDNGKVLMYDSGEATGLKIAAIPTTAPSIVGSVGTPSLITAAGGIAFTGSAYSNIKFIAGDSGAIDITANPQIAAGSAVGQRLTIISQSATDTVKLEHGTGLDLNGAWIGGLNSAIELMWDGAVWVEMSRK